MAENETPGLAYAWPLYQGTKQIKATPMAKVDYCTLRGWRVPADEDPIEVGYCVEYQDGGKPNVPGYAGYVSWSPADVFEKAYKPCDTHVDRMRIELDEIATRAEKLDDFTSRDGTAFQLLDVTERSLLIAQLSAMTTYLTILQMRLGIAEQEAPANG